MAVKAVLFDLGGTLIKTSPVSEIFKTILENLGIKRSTEEIEKARRAAEKQFDMEEMPILGDEFWLLWNTKVLEHLEIHGDTRYLAERISKQWWHYSGVELFPDVEKTLKLLRKKGLKVGLVTNGLESDIREVLPRVGLTAFFDVEVTSSIVGKVKPHREIFLHALEKLGVKPQEAMYVGDMVENDYRGARGCGLKALLIDREENVREENVEKIQSLTELLDYV
jgi:epoxide hydrolase-like predicted phosphatase